MKDTKDIKINGEKFTIKKIPLGKYGELVMAFEKLPNTLKEVFAGEDGNLTDIDTQTIIEKAPLLLFQLNQDVLKLISVASGIELKKLSEDIGLDEGLDIIYAILEVNNVGLIIEKVKNLKKVLPKTLVGMMKA
ncbi:hypothetical protein [Schinkia azotoformans]|uniref:hypothetical protein n=1 Tax=Schinkia azotoformans TaxID=1454 RepID=UPI002DBDD50D|nr:hypothetical protein [Schinkia azotoformans]MEC1786088.1 hypothetical protein [Schinkia azotoformans]MED4420124.1 hypothetical protein [Schinkia azotoformans]